MDSNDQHAGYVTGQLPRLLSMEDVAEVLGLSLRTVRRMVEKRQLPIVILNRRTVRFRPEDIRDLIRRGYLPAKTI